jgi:hypothetical protein
LSLSRRRNGTDVLCAAVVGARAVATPNAVTEAETVKLPVPCAPEEEEVRDEGGGASGERPGGAGISGAGALPVFAFRRADFVFRGLPS